LLRGLLTNKQQACTGASENTDGTGIVAVSLTLSHLTESSPIAFSTLKQALTAAANGDTAPVALGRAMVRSTLAAGATAPHRRIACIFLFEQVHISTSCEEFGTTNLN